MERHTIVLTYSEPEEEKQGEAANEGEYGDGKVTGRPSKIPCARVGDTLVFESRQGYSVNIKLEPAGMFSPNYFSTDPKFCRKHKIRRGAGVKFRKLGKFRYCCGFVEDGKTYGYPKHERLGNTGQGGTAAVKPPGHGHP